MIVVYTHDVPVHFVLPVSIYFTVVVYLEIVFILGYFCLLLLVTKL